jgi:hypothetical protein
MRTPDPLKEQDLRRLQTFIYLIPVVGFFPALWDLYRREGSRQQQAVGRLAVLLAAGWLFGYLLLGTGTQASHALALPLLVISSLLTSGYFLTNIWLMVRLWQRKSIGLPGLTQLSDRLP